MSRVPGDHPHLSSRHTLHTHHTTTIRHVSHTHTHTLHIFIPFFPAGLGMDLIGRFPQLGFGGRGHSECGGLMSQTTQGVSDLIYTRIYYSLLTSYTEWSGGVVGMEVSISSWQKVLTLEKHLSYMYIHVAPVAQALIASCWYFKKSMCTHNFCVCD